MVVVFVAGLVGVASMARRIAKREGVGLARRRSAGAGALAPVRARRLGGGRGASRWASAGSARSARGRRSAVAWYRRRWFLHAATMWGFLGLLAATILDYGLELVGIKETGTPVPIWYPVRLLGTVAGLAAGLRRRCSSSSGYRARQPVRPLVHGRRLDAPGAALGDRRDRLRLELALYLPGAPAWGYWVFLFHVAVAMELVLLAPFMKLAHAVYRPVALFFVALSREPGREAA